MTEQNEVPKKPHPLTFSTNCIKRIFQKNEEIGKVMTNASAVTIRFLELLTRDTLLKCNEVIEAKKESNIGNLPPKINVIDLSNSDDDSDKKEKSPQDFNGMQDVITLDVLHEAIKDDAKMNVIDNIIISKYPGMNEEEIDKQVRAQKRKNKGKKVKKESKSRKRKRNDESDSDSEWTGDSDAKKRKNKRRKKEKSQNKEKQIGTKKVIESNTNASNDCLIEDEKKSDSKKKFCFENVFGF